MSRSLSIVSAIVAIAITVTAWGSATAGSYKKHAQAEGSRVTENSIVDVANEAGSFKTLLAAARAAGLDRTLDQEGPFTVFAPTDDAFADLPAGALEGLLEDKEQLKAVLLLHVVPSRLTAWDVARQSSLESLNGEALRVSTKGGVMIGGANVLKADVVAINGVVHVIDRVLLPASH